MKKRDLAQRLAEQAHLSQAAAADQLDRVVHRILKNLRKGAPASLPGLGTFTPGQTPDFRFEKRSPGKGKR